VDGSNLLKTCWYCNRQLSILKSLRGDLFCSKKHEELYLSKESSLAFERLKDPGSLPPPPAPSSEHAVPVKLPKPIQPLIVNSQEDTHNRDAQSRDTQNKEIRKADESPIVVSSVEAPMPVAPSISSPLVPASGEFRTPVPEEAMTFTPRPSPPSRRAAGSERAPLLGKPLPLTLPQPRKPAEHNSLSQPVPTLHTFPPFVPVLDLVFDRFEEPEQPVPVELPTPIQPLIVDTHLDIQNGDIQKADESAMVVSSVNAPIALAPYLSSSLGPASSGFRTPVPEEAMTFIPRPSPPSRRTSGSEKAPLLAEPLYLNFPPPTKPAELNGLSDPVPSLHASRPLVPVLDLELEEPPETLTTPPLASFVFPSSSERRFPLEGSAPTQALDPALVSLDPLYPGTIRWREIRVTRPSILYRSVGYRSVGQHPFPGTLQLGRSETSAAPLVLPESPSVAGKRSQISTRPFSTPKMRLGSPGAADRSLAASSPGSYRTIGAMQACDHEGPARTQAPVVPALVSLDPLYPDTIGWREIRVTRPSICRPVGQLPVPGTPQMGTFEVSAAPFRAPLVLPESPRVVGRPSLSLSSGSYQSVGAARSNDVFHTPRLEISEEVQAATVSTRPLSTRMIRLGSHRAADRSLAGLSPGSHRTIGAMQAHDYGERLLPELKWIGPASLMVIQQLAPRAIVENRSMAYQRLLPGAMAPTYRGTVINTLDMAWAVALKKPAARIQLQSLVVLPFASSPFNIRREISNGSVREGNSANTFRSEWIQPRGDDCIQGIAPVQKARIPAAVHSGLSCVAQALSPSIAFSSRPVVGPRVRQPRLTVDRTLSMMQLALTGSNHTQGLWTTTPRQGTLNVLGAVSTLPARATYQLPATTRSTARNSPSPVQTWGFFQPGDFHTKDIAVRPLELLLLLTKALRRINLCEQPVFLASPALPRQDWIQGLTVAATGYHRDAPSTQGPKLPSPASFARWPYVKAPVWTKIGMTPLPTVESFSSFQGHGPAPIPALLSPLRVQTACEPAPPLLSGVLQEHLICGPAGFRIGVLLKIHDVAIRRHLHSHPLIESPIRKPELGREHPRSTGIRHLATETLSPFADSAPRG
jgi:hypothetical protein